jgi:MFS family permease
MTDDLFPRQTRAVVSLTSLYMLRMLGLFMILPVFALYARDFTGSTPALVGLALGAYGLSQAILQIPFGLWSDRIGRRPVIVIGLILFAAGSVVAAMAHSIGMIILGRLLQGSGAISGTLMAYVADLTSEKNRTKAMATIGASIGISFGVSLILGPMLSAYGGMAAIFWVTALLSCLGLLVIYFAVPELPKGGYTSREVRAVPELLGISFRNINLLRLNFGIFSLHFVLITTFQVLPVLLQDVVGLPRASHWQVYLPLMFFAFVAMVPAMIIAEKKQQVKPVFLGAIALMAASLFLLSFWHHEKIPMLALYFAFFTAFNLLEAMLPSLISKTAPAGSRGTAMGVYSTSQFLGAFCGGAVGGLILQYSTMPVLFIAGGGLLCAWCALASGMAKPLPLKNMALFLKEADGNISDRLLSIAGVQEVMVIPEQRRAYIKVNEKELDRTALEALAH